MASLLAENDLVLSHDESEGMFHERYRDSDSLQHSANHGELMAAT
jgi:hypothetical protein